jgi:para-nitrobenzyl esterase
MLVPDYAGECSSAGDSSAAEGWRVAKVDIKLGAIVLAFLVGGVLGAALVGIIGADDHDDALAAAVPLPAGATLVASGAGAGCGAATTSGGDDPSLVTTPDGVLRGSVNPDQRTRTFYAVPYALSPTGTQRWRPPVQTEGWSGERDATLAAKKDGCARAAYGMMAGQEDCLYVNVFAPLSRPDVDPKMLPVLVWFHGGCFISNGPETAWGGDGAALVDDAGGDVIVVTVAFRIGVFGHLASAGLKNRSDHEATAGNWGLLDQREAMRWVRRNIAAWGGDPGNVCIFGESASWYACTLTCGVRV